MKNNFQKIAAIFFTALMLTACGQDDPNKLVSSAKEYLRKNDSKAALIQIKNALQLNPDLPEGRYLLGVILLDDSNSPAAEVEFRKALALKYPIDQVVPKIAVAMLAQGRYKNLTDEWSATSWGTSSATADLQTSLALAYGAQGDTARAATAVNAALAADPEFVPALLAQARQKAAGGNADDALTMIDKVLKRVARNADAWKLRGDVLLYAKGQADLALADYRKAVEVRADFVPALHAMLGILVQQNKAEEAQKVLVETKKFARGHPQTKFIEALLAYNAGDLKQAREIVQQLLKVAQDSPALLVLSGSIELRSNSLVQAENYFARALQLAPKQVITRKLLVTTLLQSNQAEKALVSVLAGQKKEELPAELFSVAAQAYLQTGDVKTASEFFAAASKSDPTNASKRTSAALARLSDGDQQAAFAELQDIAQSDNGVSADMALIDIYLKRSDWAKALAAIDALERKRPELPVALYLRGRTLLARGDSAGARNNFEQSAVKSPGYYPAAASLATMDMADGKPDLAKTRMETVLAKDSNNGPARLALADIAAASGASKEEVIALIGAAIKANPSDSAARLRLIRAHLQYNDLKQAISSAQESVTSVPDRSELLEVLGQLQRQAGEFNQAIGTFIRLVALSPGSPAPYVQLAEVQLATANSEAAERSFLKALEIKPDMLVAQRGLVAMAVAASKVPDALDIARKVQKQRPKEDIGFAIEGDIRASQKNWAAAIAAYRTGMKHAPSSVLAVKLHEALATSGGAAEAGQFASAWRKAHVSDVAFVFHLGDMAMRSKDFAAAETAYLDVVKLQPNLAAASNNLAWLKNRLAKTGALEYAESANRLSPDQPAFMDTLAMVLAEDGKFDRALGLQQKAMKLQPTNPALRLTLAKILIKSGDKVAARRELDQLASLGPKFDSQAEIADLLKSL